MFGMVHFPAFWLRYIYEIGPDRLKSLHLLRIDNPPATTTMYIIMYMGHFEI